MFKSGGMIRTKIRWVPIIGGITLTLGCNREGASASAARMDTLNNVIHVHNVAASATWQLVEGPALETDSQGFTNAVSVIADRTGQVYVADMGEGRIRVFDSTGGLLRSIGRHGAGPAEFQDLYSLAWLGDTLVALDPGNSRVGLLTRDGSWLGQRQTQRISGRDVTLMSSGEAVFAPGYMAKERRLVRTLVRHTALGVADTIELPDLRAGQPPAGIDCQFPGGIRVFSLPFASRPLIEVDPGGNLVLARSGEYRIAVVTPKGDTLRVIEALASPRAVFPAEWNDSLTPMRSWKKEHAGVQCTGEEPAAPRTRPVLEGIWFDDRHQMWVERRDMQGHAYDVFDSSGVLFASMTAPERDPWVPPYVRGGRLYIVALNEAGGQEVKIYVVRTRQSE